MTHLLGRSVRPFRPPEALRDAGPGTNARERRKAALDKELFRATRAGDYDAMLDALAKGAEVNSRGGRQETPLMLAAAARSTGATACLQLLLDAQAEVDTKDAFGWSALLHGCRNNCLQQVEMLVKAKAFIGVSAHDGRNALMLATLEGGNRIVQFLVDHQAQLNKKDQNGWTPLFHACSQGNVDLVKWMMKHKCSAQEVAKNDYTALMSCYNAPNCTKVAYQLVKRGCSINAQCSSGETVLMLALRDDQANAMDFVRWLVQNPLLEVLVKNKDNEDAIDVADKRGLHGIRMMLESTARLQAEEQAAKDKVANQQMAAAMGE